MFCSDCGSRCNQWLKCNIRGVCCPLNYSVGPQPSDADASEYSMLYLPFFFQICTCVLLTIRYSKHIQCQRRPSLQFCCVSLHYKYITQAVVIWSYTAVPVAFRLTFLCIFYETGGTGTLVASSQRCRSAVALRSKAL